MSSCLLIVGLIACAFLGAVQKVRSCYNEFQYIPYFLLYQNHNFRSHADVLNSFGTVLIQGLK